MASRPTAAVGGPTIALALVALALVFFVLAVLYALGIVNLFSFHVGPHYKHMVLLAVLGIASLVAANFVRRKPAV